MAISLRVTGSWARLAADGTVAIPATPQAGDRMFLFATWKDYTITVATPDGWTPINSEFADGTVAAGNGTGSVKVMAWYRDWQSGDSDPTIDWSANPTEGHAVIMVWAKNGGEAWDTPLSATGAMTNWTTTSQTFSASSTVAVKNGAVVMGLVGIRDDSATMTRPTSGIDDSAGSITWNGNYVESPATHFSSTTGSDMSGDLGYRLVTTGATVTLRMTGTISAAETGAGKWVVQGVHTDTNVTPTTLALTIATFAPTVTTTNNVLVTPDVLALTLATFAPTVVASDHKIVTPDVLVLTVSTFAPTVQVGTVVTPGTLALTLTTYEPTVTVGAGGVTVTPTTLALVLSTFAPSVSVSSGSVTCCRIGPGSQIGR